MPWVGGTILLILTAVALYTLAAPAASTPSTAREPSSADIAYGPDDAPVVVVEYSDFQCSFCAQYAPMLASLRSEYGDRVRFVFRFFPLNYHEHGMLSAQAAYAAFLQGKFWEMHDMLYANQQEWAEAGDALPYFERYAESVGLDMERFRADIQAQDTIDFIVEQRAEGDQAGISHTPWFIVDGADVTPRSLEEFKALIEAAL
jgi:protein-disulfide isomerase